MYRYNKNLPTVTVDAAITDSRHAVGPATATATIANATIATATIATATIATTGATTTTTATDGAILNLCS